MAQQFEPSSETSTLRAQRMTADEARAVIALWQSERVELTGLTDKPAVPDVAEGLDIRVEDVQRLLTEVRATRLEEERALASKQELVKAERRLAKEEANLSEVRRQRAELQRREKEAEWEKASPWQPPQAFHRLRRRQPRQPAPIEWTGNEGFWQESEDDEQYRVDYRAAKVTSNFVYGLYGVLLLVPAVLAVWLILSVLGMEPI